MKILKLVSIVFLFILSGCSNEEQFACGAWGLSVSDKSASYGPTTLPLCSKDGVQNTYSDNCNSSDRYVLIFDTISHKLVTHNGKVENSLQFIQCKKVK